MVGRIRQRKALGQVFLTESWPCQKIAEQLKRYSVSRTLEIGPGAGALTEVLLDHGIQVDAVETDPRWVEYLQDKYKEDKRVEVINEDILKFDLESWVGQSKATTAVVGNIPYNISTPILIKSLESLPNLACVIFMTQLEFAERIAAKPGKKTYGSISVFTNLRAKSEFLGKVGKNCFKPVPKVDSALFSLTYRDRGESQKVLQMAESIARKAFQQRRKMLSNSISSFLPKDLNTDDFPIDLTRRSETLTPEEFIQLAKLLN